MGLLVGMVMFPFSFSVESSLPIADEKGYYSPLKLEYALVDDKIPVLRA